MLSILFLLGGFRLFGIFLLLIFGLVLFAFLIAHDLPLSDLQPLVFGVNRGSNRILDDGRRHIQLFPVETSFPVETTVLVAAMNACGCGGEPAMTVQSVIGDVRVEHYGVAKFRLTPNRPWDGLPGSLPDARRTDGSVHARGG